MMAVPPPAPMTERNPQIGKTVPKDSHSPDLLRWHESLYVRFTALGLLLWLLFVLSSVWLTQKVSVKNSTDENNRSVGLAFDLITQQAQTLAGSIVQLSLNPAEGLAGVRANVPKLIDRNADSGLIAAVGVWPMPNTLDPARERASLIWPRDDSGVFRLREDYNDPRTVPYIHEKWFTPARYSLRDRCYWTPTYQEPLTKRLVSTCTMPIRGSQGFIGAVTVSLNLDAVAKKLALMDGADNGYGLLVTQGGEVLITVGTLDGASQSVSNLAELARERPALNPLALRLHQEHQETVRAIGLRDEQISALKNETREMSHEEAESALAMLALTPPAGEIKPSYQTLSLNDSSLKSATVVTLFSLPGQWWILVRVTPGEFLFPGFGREILPDLMSAFIMLAFIVLILWMLRSRILNPLQQMTEQLAATAGARDTFHTLDDTARNEMGGLAYWHNESQRHLQQQLEQARALRAQQSAEQGERRSTQETSAKVRERTSLALQSVADGVIILNEQGRVEDMNLAAERFTGIALRSATGKAFSEVFNARALKDSKEPLPDLAKIASQQTTPMEYPQGLRLHSAKGGAQDIQLSFFPMQTRLGVSAGCIAVFRKKGAETTSAGAAASEQRMLDNMTGMPMRGACENHLRDLINQSRLTPQQHALLFIDADDLKSINETKGHQAGDDVISEMASILIGLAGEENQAYRLYGDRFAIILGKTDPVRTRAFAEQLCGRFAGSALRGQALDFRITISIGIAMVDGSSPTPSEVIRRGELACNAAKQAGRNQAQEWLPSLEESKQLVDDSLWLKRIRAGLEQDMFHLTTQKIKPMSAHAEDGPAFQMLMALEDEEGFWSTAPSYMPTAQRHNLTHEIDLWLINRTITHLQLHPATLEKLSFIGIQLSAAAISDNDLLEYLMKFFSDNPSISARKFCFAFSEQALQKSPQQTLIFCEVMRNLGCHLCIDGFVGRRTSDIELLRKLPIDFIRIDAMQFPNLEKDSIELMMSESLIHLARTLKKRIIVTNLDGSTQQYAWEALFPDYLQGGAVAKPSPVIFSGT